jgi:hypothetical protein
VRLLSLGTAALTAAAVSLWPTAILIPAGSRTVADLRSAAIAATVLAGILAGLRVAAAEVCQRERRQQARERALIRVIDRGGEHPSGPFRAVR